MILEILPYGAVCNFANPEGEPWRATYSYFNLLPFGYANFGPFITAVLTCVMIVFAVLFSLKPMPKVLPVWKVIAVVTSVTSLAPIMYGLHFYSAVGGAISLLLVAEFFALRSTK